jgi:hypothetical protein
LFVVARAHARSALLPVLVIAVLGVAYALLYVLRVESLLVSSLPLTYSLLVILGVEMCFDLGLLPSFGWLDEAFRKLPFDLQILPISKDLATDQVVDLTREGGGTDPLAIETDSARGVDPLVERALATRDVPACGQISFRLDERPNVAYKAFRLHGGIALLTEDVSRLDERRRTLRTQQEVLRERNALLMHDEELRRGLLRLRRERMLFEEVDRTLSSSVEQMREAMDTLPSGDSQDKLGRKALLGQEARDVERGLPPVLLLPRPRSEGVGAGRALAHGAGRAGPRLAEHGARLRRTWPLRIRPRHLDVIARHPSDQSLRLHVGVSRPHPPGWSRVPVVLAAGPATRDHTLAERLPVRLLPPRGRPSRHP